MSKIHSLNVPHRSSLIAPDDLIKQHPLSRESQLFIEQKREEVKRILDGIDSRYLLIVGPCSIHDTTATKEYATKLRELSETVSDTFCILMRVYFEKARTCNGWKGLVYDPDLDGSSRIQKGLEITRELLIDLNEMGVPAGCELLDAALEPYLGDLISWGCIGARTSESQTHRQLASGLPFPVAFKNSTIGNVNVAIQGIMSASQPHSHVGINELGKLNAVHTRGNSHAHLVLRGAETHTNYDPASISAALEKLRLANLPPRLIVDCAHGNSQKLHEKQPRVFESVMNQIIEGNDAIRGLILESFLHAGNQPHLPQPSELRYGVSITDPCLDWTTTEQLIIWAHHKIQKEKSQQPLPAMSQTEL